MQFTENVAPPKEKLTVCVAGNGFTPCQEKLLNPVLLAKRKEGPGTVKFVKTFENEGKGHPLHDKVPGTVRSVANVTGFAKVTTGLRGSALFTEIWFAAPKRLVIGAGIIKNLF